MSIQIPIVLDVDSIFFGKFTSNISYMLRCLIGFIKPLLIVVLFPIIVLSSCNPDQKKVKSEFKQGEPLSKYYNLDNIKLVEIENWKGKHTLSKLELEQFTADLASYKYDGKYANTKPGHLSCKIIFKDNVILNFYSNTTSEIIISESPVDDQTFLPTKRVNFENY